MPKVSVILPVYNASKYVREALDSVINQTLSDIEIICINDGSTDNSLEILEEYAQKDARIRIHSQENRGPSAARNVGMEIATGEYIGFIDADDKIDLNFYEELYKNAAKYGADIAAASIYRIKGHKRKFILRIPRVKVIEKTSKKYRALNLPHWSYVWNKIYNTKVLKDLGFQFPEGKLYEDIVFTHEILHSTKKLVVVPKVKYYYYINSDSITNNLTEKHYRDLKDASIAIQKFAQENNICKGIGKHWYSELVREVKFYNIPIFAKYKYGKYSQYRVMNIPVFFKKEMTRG